MATKFMVYFLQLARTMTRVFSRTNRKSLVIEIHIQIQFWRGSRIKRCGTFVYHLFDLLPEIPLSTPNRINYYDIPGHPKCIYAQRSEYLPKRFNNFFII